jgi:hypothetical protein
VAAYLDADRESGAPDARAAIRASGLPAQQEYAALVEIERALDTATRALLEGKKVNLQNALQREVPSK